MKSIFLTIALLLFLGSQAQTFTDEKSFTINTDELESFRLHNLDGVVKVTGTTGNVATLNVRRRLKTSSQQRLEEAKDEFFLDSLMDGDHLYFFSNVRDFDFRIDSNGNGYYRSCCNGRDWYDRNDVQYKFEIELRVPNSVKLYVSNHHDQLEIKNFTGELYAKNHHKDLYAEGIAGNGELLNHHGNIEASFIRNPTSDCKYATHHGDIRIAFQEALSADVFLSSHHGDFFTEFDWEPSNMPLVQTDDGRKTKYIVNDQTAVRIGSGGPQLNFKTWHGDIIISQAKK